MPRLKPSHVLQIEHWIVVGSMVCFCAFEAASAALGPSQTTKAQATEPSKLTKEQIKRLNEQEIKRVKEFGKELRSEHTDVRRGAAGELSNCSTLHEYCIDDYLVVHGDGYQRGRDPVVDLAADLLLGAVIDPDARVRASAAKGLDRIGDSRVIDPLMTLLRDPDEEVREIAARALGSFRDPRAVEPLIGLLNRTEDCSRACVCYIASSLGELKDQRAVEPLIAALKETDNDQNDEVAESVIRALKEIGDPRAIRPLIALLREMGQQERSEYSINPRHSRGESALWALRGIGSPSIEPLIAALDSPDYIDRESAAVALGEYLDARAFSALLAYRKRLAEINYKGLIMRGESGSETRLIEALDVVGDENMALAFANSGNSKLGVAADLWARKRGLEFKANQVPSPSHYSHWGTRDQ